MNVVINLDGVIRDDSGSLITDGLLLYKAMKASSRVTLLSSMSLDLSVAWLAMNHIHDVDDIVPPIEGLSEYDMTIQQIAIARRHANIDYYIEANPRIVAETLRQGICSLLFVTPVYGRPDWRPDAPGGFRKSWGQIVEERSKQLALRAADNRITQQDIGGFE